MTQAQSFRLLIAHMAVALGILAGATVLCAIGKLQSDAVIALYGAAVGLLGGNAQSLGQAAINGGPKPDLTKLAQSGRGDLAASLSGPAAPQPGAASAIEADNVEREAAA